MIERLSPEQLADTLKGLPRWKYDQGRRALYRRLKFRSFKEALCAMVRVGMEAEAADHHPEWTNVYNLIDIWLTTHDAKGVTMRDVALARRIDLIVKDMRRPAEAWTDAPPHDAASGRGA